MGAVCRASCVVKLNRKTGNNVSMVFYLVSLKTMQKVEVACSVGGSGIRG